ncbi:MAG: peptidoglycan synthetase [Bacteroidetes bacterium 4572_77]|nr:MAG: peptidoglycan synthetase [Bacteroidetes bacterium 4572_77]
MNYHFIAIGGAAMHNLAIALHLKGNKITGSDDEIFEPSKGRLEKYNLLPVQMGWNSENIHKDIDAVILGMHAREDNPELAKAKDLKIPIYSYPEFIYEQSKHKTRVVIGGSHGKTTITAMVLHVLEKQGVNADYMVGSKLDGFEVMVKLSESAPVIVLEGDEYLSSPIDRRPKFHLYKPHIALISGIAWDHINVFPTFEIYKEQFSKFIDLIEPNGSLAYAAEDPVLKTIVESAKANIDIQSYDLPTYYINAQNNKTVLIFQDQEYELMIFGAHNLRNLEGARQLCEKIGIAPKDFYTSIRSFSGASNRLETIATGDSCTIFKDFAHSPSKLKATTQAVKNQFAKRKLVAVMELHTFSSLNAEFLSQYKDAMNDADTAIVYYNPETIKHKRLEPISVEQVKKAFANENLQVFTDSQLLVNRILQESWKHKNLLLMSSGNFDGVDYIKLSEEILATKP